MTIAPLPESERPRERCLLRGADCLSLRECLAIILGTGPPRLGCLGLAQQMLDLPGQGLSEADAERAFFTALEISGPAALENASGLGRAGKARVLAGFELARRYAIFREARRRPLASPLPESRHAALARVGPELRADAREWLGFVPFYRPGELGGLCLVERGVRTHVNVDPAELFARVLALRPKAFYLVHNHPSGDLRPSASDREMTEQVAKAARLVGTCLLGHWVVATGGETYME